MPRKQLKIALSESFHDQLAEAALKQKMPISTYARWLMSKQLGVEAGTEDHAPRQGVEQVAQQNAAQFAQAQDQTAQVTAYTGAGPSTSGDDDLLLLSDILSEEAEGQQPAAAKTAKAGSAALDLNGSGVNINIVINKG